MTEETAGSQVTCGNSGLTISKGMLDNRTGSPNSIRFTTGARRLVHSVRAEGCLILEAEGCLIHRYQETYRCWFDLWDSGICWLFVEAF